MRTVARLVAGGIVGLTLACGNSTGPTGDLLSDAEIQALTAILVGEALDDGLGGAVGGGGSATTSEPVDFDLRVDETSTCDGGGSVRVTGSISGSIDTGAGEGSLLLEIEQTVSGCVLTTEQHGTFTVSTDPTIKMNGNVAWGATGPVGTSTFSYKGDFTWLSEDGREGGCGIDLSLSWSAASASYTGKICGNEYTFNLST